MTVQRILIVSGTHGNEINPVWAVKQFNRRENSLNNGIEYEYCLLYTSPSPRDRTRSRMPSSA